MKKILFVVLALAFLGPEIYSQNCTCAPAGTGWQPVVVTQKGINTTVKCGHQFSLKCTDSISLRTSYKCVGNCTATYSAVLKNSAGVVVKTWASFSFPLGYKFNVAGTYSLEITPQCGQTKCEPCRFFFTVTCPPPPTTTCDCKVDGWQVFTATVGTVQSKVRCENQFAIKKNQVFKLDGKYFCNGNCTATYKAVLRNNVTNAIVVTYSPFTMPWSYTFTIAGTYRLEITPYCGSHACMPCKFYFTVA